MICDMTAHAPTNTRIVAGLLGGVVGMIPIWFVGNVWLLPLAVVFGALLGFLLRWIPSCTGQSLAVGFFYGVGLGVLYQLLTTGMVATPQLQMFGLFGLAATIVARLYLRRAW